MSLPAGQQRVLDSMENRLRADEPHLASMFGIFARLSVGEPVSTEGLSPRVRWRRPPGAALYAVVIFPVIFSLIVIGALLSGGAHGTRTCDVGFSVGGGSAAPASQYAIRTNGDLAVPPSAGASPVPGDTSGMC
jgi:Protein of unknown function (DUF3040)